MPTQDLTLTRDAAMRGTRPLGGPASGTQGLAASRPGTRPFGGSLRVDARDEEGPGRISPAMASKIRALIAKLSSLLAMVPPELRGKIMALIAQAEGALSGFWVGDLGALVGLMERTVQLLNQLAGWGDLRDLRALATRNYWERKRLLAELNRLLGNLEIPGTDSLSTRREPDPIDSLSAMIRARF